MSPLMCKLNSPDRVVAQLVPHCPRARVSSDSSLSRISRMELRPCSIWTARLSFACIPRWRPSTPPRPCTLLEMRHHTASGTPLDVPSPASTAAGSPASARRSLTCSDESCTFFPFVSTIRLSFDWYKISASCMATGRSPWNIASSPEFETVEILIISSSGTVGFANAVAGGIERPSDDGIICMYILLLSVTASFNLVVITPCRLTTVCSICSGSLFFFATYNATSHACEAA
mmetsp:Transcript_2768/g.3953  ORF Transcript_2768/g.3953 Transcript_2768/m.3953 type:complete len:232 (-) Transcript_2768:1141-1836(-)